MRDTLKALDAAASRAAPVDRQGLGLLRGNLDQAIQAYEGAVAFMLEHAQTNIRAVYAASVPYLMLAGIVHGGWQMARAALACLRYLADGGSDPFYRAKLSTALFYGAQILPRALSLSVAVRAGDVAAVCGAQANIT